MIDRVAFNELEANGKLDKERSYWSEKMQGDLELSKLLSDSPLTHKGSVHRSVEEVELPVSLVKSMISMCKDSDYALYVLFLAGVQYILYRYTGSQDITVGMPVFTNAGNATGTKMNDYVPLRLSLDTQGSVKDLLKIARVMVTEANEHQNYPLERILRNAGLDIHAAESVSHPFPVTVQMDRIHSSLAKKELQREMVFELRRNEEQLFVQVHYDESQYTSQSVNQWLSHLICFLEQAVENPNRKLTEIELMSEAEHDLILTKFNDTQTPYARSRIHELIEEQVLRTPNKAALYCGNERLTYAEMNQQANQLARKLQSCGVKTETLVGVLMERSCDMIIGILAVLKAGGAYVPLDPSYPRGRIRYVLEETEAPVLLANEALVREIDLDFKGEIVDLSKKELWMGKDDSNLGATSEPCNLAYTIFTSGSTGKPKGVMVEHHSVMNRLAWMQKRYPLDSNDVVLQKTPISFDVSVWELFWGFCQGAALALLPPRAEKDVASIVEAVDRYRVTTIHFVPAMLQVFLESVETQDLTPLHTLTNVFSSGEALHREQVERFDRTLRRACHANLVNLYGPTEATVDVSYYECTEKMQTSIVPIGRPIDNTRLYLLNSEKQLQPVGAVGEIYISGVNVARGYLNKPELTKERFFADPYRRGERMYRTGDLGRWLPDGNVEYLGRMDHQTKIRGYRIEPGEIEATLLQYDQVSEAVVLVQRLGNQQELIAFYVSGEPLDVTQMKHWLAEHLPSFMIPSIFIHMDKLPASPNGKIDRKQLMEMKLTRNQAAYVPPQSELQQQLVDIWQRVLGLNGIGMDDRYWDLGGDSIQSIRLVSLINKECDVHLSLLDMVQDITVRKMESAINEAKGDNRSSNMVSLEGFMQVNVPEASALESLRAYDYEDYYPMSSIQQGMIFHSLKDWEQAIYHEQFAYDYFDPQFCMKTLERALNGMVQKHPILRTVYNLFDFSVPMLIVLKSIELDLAEIDLSGLETERQKDLILQYMQNDREKPFISGASKSMLPLWRMRVFRLTSEGHFYIGCFFHHSILDGWSNASFITELANMYLALQAGEPVDPEPLKHTYKEYVADQLRIKEDQELLEFWRTELQDYKRYALVKRMEERAAIAVKEKVCQLGDSFYSEIRDFAQQNGTTARSILFAAYAFMLYMNSYENDFIVGIVEHNRPVCEDGDKMLGCFLNNVPVRIVMEPNMTWSTYLAELSSKLMRMKHFGRLPLAEINQVIGEKTNNGSVLFDHIFNFVEFQIFQQLQYKHKEQSELIINDHERTDLPLEWICHRQDDNFLIKAKYSTEYFTDEQIDSFFSYFKAILSDIMIHFESPMSKNRLLQACHLSGLYWSGPEESLVQMKSLPERLEERLQSDGDEIGIVCGSVQVSYREIRMKADLIAAELMKLGVQRGGIVGIMADRSPDMLIGMIAIHRAGAAYLPIDPEYPVNRINYMLEDSRVTVVLTQRQYADKLTSVPNPIWMDTLDSKADHVSLPLPLMPNPEDLAYMIYTSGSTGQPKGVMIEHGALSNFVAGIERKLPFRKRETALFLTTISFDIFIVESLIPLALGLSVVIATHEEQNDPKLLGQLMERQNIHFLQTTPSRMQLLLGDENIVKSLNSMTVMLGGEALKPHLVDQMSQASDVTLFQAYGPTETTVWSMIGEVETSRSISLGDPILNTQVCIVDRLNQIQPLGTQGELCISGKGLARGYLNHPELDAEKFIPHPLIEGEMMYKTGDLVEWTEPEKMIFLGRIDHQVKIRGIRIELGEIENVLLSHPEVQSCKVVARNHDSQGAMLVAYYVADLPKETATLRDFLGSELPGYMIPNFLIHMSDFPLMPNGKINLHELPDPKLMRMPSERREMQGKTEKERQLLQLWKKVLQTDDVGVTDNFMELGGTSFLVVQLHMQMDALYPGKLNVVDLFSYPTVKSLAKFLDETEQREQAQALLLEGISFPSDYIKGARSEKEMITLKIRLEPPLVSGLKRMAQHHKVAEQSVIVAAFLYLLYELSDQARVGSYVKTKEVARVTVDFEGLDHFSNLLSKISEELLSENNQVPLDWIAPFRNQKDKLLPLVSEEKEAQATVQLLRHFDFIWSYSEDAEGIQVRCRFYASRLDSDKMKELLSAFKRLVQAIVADMSTEKSSNQGGEL